MSTAAVLTRLALVALVTVIGARGAVAASASPISGAVAGVVLGALVVVAERVAARARIDRLFWAVVGGGVGSLVGMVAGLAVLGIAPGIGAGPLALGAVLGTWLGAAVGLRRGPDITGLNAALFPRAARERPGALIDTSAIIDGRIADLAATGFLGGPLLVPQFVLREVQRVADAADPRRRARGKRGFEVVQRLLHLPGRLVEVDDTDVPEVADVDEKLLALAKARGAKVITTDYNLNKRAELSGVTVLNVNDLSNALKPTAVAGEVMRVHVLREGKELGQGVAYLDDGTMVVVDHGKRWIGQTVDVAVTSVLQTSAGRIIFTRPRDEEAARA
jgi:uncharacterized protein YacL